MQIKLSDLITASHSIKAGRRHFIGGSDARIIMSADEAALIRLWKEKRGEAEPEDWSDNLIVQLGVATEALNRRITLPKAPDCEISRGIPCACRSCASSIKNSRSAYSCSFSKPPGCAKKLKAATFADLYRVRPDLLEIARASVRCRPLHFRSLLWIKRALVQQVRLHKMVFDRERPRRTVCQRSFAPLRLSGLARRQAKDRSYAQQQRLA